MHRHVVIWALLLAVCIWGCAGTGGLGSAKKTANLRPGMTFVEAFEILGQPKSSAFQGDEWVVKYSLHEYWKGWVPYYVVFDKKTKQVTHWFADETEYQQNQQKWMMLLQAMQETEQAYDSRQGGGDAGGGGAVYMGDYGTTDAGSYESYDTFETDSAGWPGGAYQNPSSSYYEPAVYE